MSRDKSPLDDELDRLYDQLVADEDEQAEENDNGEEERQWYEELERGYRQDRI